MDMKTGIYKITSPSGKVYIGQSINIEQRWKDYKRINKNIGPKIKHSLMKYGSNNHVLEIIEECSVELLDERETYYKQQELNKIDNDWSKVLFCELHDEGGGPKSEETKRKIGKANLGKKRSEETKQKIGLTKINNKYALGFKFNQESKDKISKAKKNHICYLNEERNKKIGKANLGKKRSEETKQKISILRQNPRIKNKTNKLNKEEIIKQINTLSIKQIAEKYSVSVGTVRNFLKSMNND